MLLGLGCGPPPGQDSSEAGAVVRSRMTVAVHVSTSMAEMAVAPALRTEVRDHAFLAAPVLVPAVPAELELGPEPKLTSIDSLAEPPPISPTAESPATISSFIALDDTS